MHPRATQLIRDLELGAHPEGGFFREIFRSPTRVDPCDGRPRRAALTTIFFLLAHGQVSRWHAVRSDEVWHLYEGGPLELFIAAADLSSIERVRLAPVAAHASPTRTVAAGCWQAARPLGDYALAGCTVAPGFEYEDFAMLSDDPRAAARLRIEAPDLAAML
jgi:predicted cupin superfamily sugar epimerase